MMNEGGQTPVYLARRSYRQRRLRDAAKMIPIAGIILWLMPLVAAAPKSGATGLYIFGVWLGLIVVSAIVSVRLRDDVADKATSGGSRDAM